MAREGSNSTEHWPYIQAHLFGQLSTLSSEREESISAPREGVTRVIGGSAEGHLPHSDPISCVASHALTTGTTSQRAEQQHPRRRLGQMCAGMDVARKTGNSFCPCQGLVTNDTVGRKNRRRYLWWVTMQPTKLSLVTNTWNKHSPGHRHWKSPVHISESKSTSIKLDGDIGRSAHSLFWGMAGEQGHFPRLPARDVQGQAGGTDELHHFCSWCSLTHLNLIS